jgi:hypothetical protein
MLRAVLLVGVLSAACRPVHACQCEAAFGACKEVRVSDLVFIGTVQSIQPLFLSRWYGANQPGMRSLNDALLQAQEHPSPDSLRQVKDAYLATFPQSDALQKRLVESADNIQQVSALMDSSLDRGMRVHFQVKALYKQEDDDDDAAKKPAGKDKKGDSKIGKKDDDGDKDDDKPAPAFLDVWSAAGDCGIDFQLGETYLVFANNEEGADYYFTSSCMRTKRLSEAGEDLGYLYFYKNQPEASSRLDGFTTSDRKAQLTLDPLHEPTAIGSPVSGIILQLQSDHFMRYAESDGNGRFLFDGLPDGSYQISAFAPGYPKTDHMLAGPRHLIIREKSCVRQVFVLPKAGG